jgi:hexulose-6-phosphate isomerase
MSDPQRDPQREALHRRKSITLRAFPPAMTTAARLALAAAAGFAAVEVNLEPSEEYTPDTPDAGLRDLRRAVEAHGLQVSAVYNRQQWLYPLTSRCEATRRQGMAIIEHLVHAAQVLGTDAVLVVPGAVDNRLFAAQYGTPPEVVPYAEAYANAQTCLRTLAALGPETGVTLAVENVWNKFLLSPLEMARFVDEIGSPWAKVYFDVGNVLRTGFPEHWIPLLGPRIHRIHLKDYRLAAESAAGFVGLLQGDVDWPAVRAALEAIGYQGWLTAEVLPAYRYHGERLIHETSAAIDAIFGPAARPAPPA